MKNLRYIFDILRNNPLSILIGFPVALILTILIYNNNIFNINNLSNSIKNILLIPIILANCIIIYVLLIKPGLFLVNLIKKKNTEEKLFLMQTKEFNEFIQSDHNVKKILLGYLESENKPTAYANKDSGLVSLIKHGWIIKIDNYPEKTEHKEEFKLIMSVKYDGFYYKLKDEQFELLKYLDKENKIDLRN